MTEPVKPPDLGDWTMRADAPRWMRWWPIAGKIDLIELDLTEEEVAAARAALEAAPVGDELGDRYRRYNRTWKARMVVKLATAVARDRAIKLAHHADPKVAELSSFLRDLAKNLNQRADARPWYERVWKSIYNPPSGFEITALFWTPVHQHPCLEWHEHEGGYLPWHRRLAQWLWRFSLPFFVVSAVGALGLWFASRYDMLLLQFFFTIPFVFAYPLMAISAIVVFGVISLGGPGMFTWQRRRAFVSPDGKTMIFELQNQPTLFKWKSQFRMYMPVNQLTGFALDSDGNGRYPRTLILAIGRDGFNAVVAQNRLSRLLNSELHALLQSMFIEHRPREGWTAPLAVSRRLSNDLPASL